MASLTVPACVPSPAEDCEQLNQAFSGWGTNEKLIVEILAHRNAAQRSLIRQTYSVLYGQDLLVSLGRELSSDFEKAVLLWTLDPSDRDAVLVEEAVRKWKPCNHRVLVEIACTRSCDELISVRKAYQSRFKKCLEEDIAVRVKGEFKKLLLPLVTGYRYEATIEANMPLAKSEAKILHQKISDKAYDDDEVVRILTTRGKAQLRATFNHYTDGFGTELVKDLLERDPKNEFLSALRATVLSTASPAIYFEEVLRHAINKTGTDEGALTRVVATRAEVDMEVIKREYMKRNSVSLENAIMKDTRGDYETMLLALLGHQDA